MAIVTLTTDLGLKDYYVGAVKGTLLSINPNLQIVDITHDIPVFDIAVAAYTLLNTYEEFPKGTIHIIGVNTEANEHTRHLIIKKNGHFFVGADNGVFSILFGNDFDEAFEISIYKNPHLIKFATKEVFAKIAGELSLGEGMENFGFPTDRLMEKTLFQATTEVDLIKGMVVYVDHYGNLMTNIDRNLFELIGQGRTFQIHFRRTDYTITQLSDNYSSVPEGERVAFFGHNNMLQISINKANASKLFGLKNSSVIRIEFSNAMF